MRKFGYLDSSSTTTSETLYHEEAITAAIRNMQKYGALNETGILDNATLKVSLRKRYAHFRLLEIFIILYITCVYLLFFAAIEQTTLWSSRYSKWVTFISFWKN